MQTHKKRTPLFGEKATTKSLVVMVRPVSVGRKARLSFFLSLSLSNEENDDDDDDARLNNNNNNALSLSKSFCFSLRTTHAREFIISSPTRSNTHSSSLSLSLSRSNHTGHAPAKTARVWETRRYVVHWKKRSSFFIFPSSLPRARDAFSRARRSRRVGPTRNGREKGLKIFEFSPPLSLSFFPI